MTQRARQEDFGPSIVQGLNLKQRMERGLVCLIPAEQTEGGIVTAEALRKPAECLLDELLARGFLGVGDTAKRRHEAGMWFRTLYHEKACMSPRSTGYYGEGRGGDEDIPDHVAWNRRCVNDTLRALAGLGKATADVCCHDELTCSKVTIQTALDRLADHRGM